MIGLLARARGGLAAALACAILPSACVEHSRTLRPLANPEFSRVQQRVFATDDVGLVLRASAWTLFELGFVSMRADHSADHMEGLLHAKSPSALGWERGVEVHVKRRGNDAVLVTLSFDNDDSPAIDAAACSDSFFAPLSRTLRIPDRCPTSTVEPTQADGA